MGNKDAFSKEAIEKLVGRKLTTEEYHDILQSALNKLLTEITEKGEQQ